MIRRQPTPEKEPAADQPFIPTESVTVRDVEFTFVGPTVFSLTLEPIDIVEVTPDELVINLFKGHEEIRINKHQLLHRSTRSRTIKRPIAGEPIGK